MDAKAPQLASGTVGSSRQVAQPLEHRWRQQIVGASPTPVSTALAGHIHSRLITEIEQVLQWNHGQRRRG
jgi:hypothetical protein